MNGADTILPGARVRTREGIVGTVERVETVDADGGVRPITMAVRADGQGRRYEIPVMLVDSIVQGPFYTIVNLSISADEIAHYGAAPPEPAVVDNAPAAALPDGEWMPDDPNAVLRVPLAAEEITIYKQAVELGSVHIHKGVESVKQSMTVPVYREEAVVERIAPDQYDASAPIGPNEVIIPVVEEQLVVEKRSVVTGYIRVRKNIVTEQRTVHDTLRHAFVEVQERRRDGKGAQAAPLLRELAPGDADKPTGP